MKDDKGLLKKVLTTGLMAIAVAAATLDTATLANAAVAAVAAPTFGIHDSAINACDDNETKVSSSPRHPIDYAKAISSLTSSYWAALHVSTVRFSVPWDIAYHHDDAGNANGALEVEQLCLNYWLTEVAALGMQPEIAFKPDYNYLTRDHKHIRVPDISTYRAAMDAFIADYTTCTINGQAGGGCVLPPTPPGYTSYPAHAGAMAKVKIIAPWGEPNFAGSGKAGFAHLPQVFAMPQRGTFDNPNCGGSFSVDTCGPVLAAQMWVAVYHRCTDHCTVIAGDFSSTGGLETNGAQSSYLATYAAYLKNMNGPRHAYRPTVWGVHPYSDVADIENCYAHVPHAHAPSLVARFTATLHQLHYGQSTQIWLDEISTFYRQALNDKVHPQWNRTVQREAAQYLITDLTRAGGRTIAGQPVVTRIYYLRYQDGPTFPRWALVVGGSREPVYTVFANRSHLRPPSPIHC